MLLIRHADRERHGGEKARLSAAGRWQAEQLGATLASDGLYRPEAILCSESRHAHEHAKIISGLLPRSVPVTVVAALTPGAPESAFSIAGMRREAAQRLNWKRLHIVACVGHETRLQQLAHAMTGTKPDILQHSETQCIEGDSWEALEKGDGRLAARFNTGSIAHGDEKELVDKIHSKMHTSALLAGFSFTVLVAVLTQLEYWQKTAPGWEQLAVASAMVFLTLATLLFVVAIYMYDRLAMPRRYWNEAGDTAPPHDNWRSFRRNRVRHGPLYAHMVWIWHWVFSVAVGMAMLGFFTLILHRNVWLVAVVCFVAIASAIAYYVTFRPQLGPD
jgi:phosphohistidine phosphatase SixA